MNAIAFILVGCCLTTAVAQPKLKVNHQALNFLVLGDWGRNGAGHQKLVAEQMGKSAEEVSADFIVSTGDNFYPSGVSSEFDPLWKYSFEDIYTAFSLQWEAQIAYSKISRRWNMPARYYEKRFPINGDTTNQVLIAFIDTNPLIGEFYRKVEYSHNVGSQDSTFQKQWLERVLSNPSPNIKWKIVVGHHPLYTGSDKRKNSYDIRAVRGSLKSILQKHKVHAYIAGHEHSLQYIFPAGFTHHFISGAASEATQVGKLPESKFAASQYGFMVFSVTPDKIVAQVIDYMGTVLYNTEIKNY